jgi:OOP family OmpA-OmpF porin
VGGESGELESLRQLLVGPELEQLAALNERVADPAKRTLDLAEALPGAIRAARPKPLREALEPVLEKAFSASVRKNPRELADAIYPIMGPAIRNSIAASIRDFAEALNQIVEKSVSIRALKWRVESIMTGRPFAEILLARSMRYAVEQVFLVHRKSGLLLQHVAARGSVVKDADMISGMLTAIQDFLADSFTEGAQDLERVDASRFELWLTHSPKVLLVAAVGGTPPVELRQVFRKALDRVEELLQSEINNFKQDDLSVFEPAKPILEACLLGQSTSSEKMKTARLWPYLALVGALLLAFVVWRGVVARRWDGYFQALRAQPGIVITGIERRGGSWVVSGLKDPDAPDPALLLDRHKLARGEVRFAFQPFLSMEQPFASRRALDETAGRIQRQIIRFDTNSSRLAISEAARIEDLALEIGELLRAAPGAQIAITGHSDETGSPGVNEKLSLDRADRVADLLVAQGVRRDALHPAGVGDTSPLRKGESEFDQATNRGVSFTVMLR